MPQSFCDLNEKKWNYTLNNRNLRLIATETGVNLVNMALAERNMTSLLDMLFINKAIYICCQKSAKESKISFDKFDEAMEVPYYPDIHQGFLEELQLFFRKTGQMAMAGALKEMNVELKNAMQKEIEESPSISGTTEKAIQDTILS